MVSGELWRRRRDDGARGESVAELMDHLPTDFHGDLDPEGPDEDWVYTEKFIYMPHCEYFVIVFSCALRYPIYVRTRDVPNT